MVKIYEIICPISNNPVYIGMTKNTVLNRLNQHLKNPQGTKEKIKWTNNINNLGLIPKINELETLNYFDLDIEKNWIEKYKKLGFNLFNANGNTKKEQKISITIQLSTEALKILERAAKRQKQPKQVIIDELIKNQNNEQTNQPID
jgi:hypothetical protein